MSTETENGASSCQENMPCDGVVCYAGVDWWYHNRGHSECQVMTRLARSVPVLWVNSIGMRAPAPGKTELLWHRYLRKLKSTLKGLKRDPESQMWVYSPLFVPRYTPAWLRFNGLMLSLQIKWLCRKLGVRRPSVWVTVPTVADAVQRGRWQRIVFNRSDEFSKFPEADADLIAPLEDRLLRFSDEVVYVNHTLFNRERDQCHSAHFIGHGVDVEHFQRDRNTGPVPDRMRNLPRPIFGFYGGLDDFTLDRELMVKVARHVHPGTFVIIGPKVMDTSALEAEPNVRYLGPIPYKQLPEYAAQFDVGIMPWQQNEWIRSCNPIKLKEYLALGFPIVTIGFSELQPYRKIVYSAESHDGFLDALDRALVEKDESLVRRRRQSVAGDTWDRIADRVGALLNVGPIT